MRATDESRDRVVQVLKEGGKTSQITRRPLIKYTMGGALGLFAVPLVLQVAGSLGPMPQKSLSYTFWNGGPSGPGEEAEVPAERLMRDPEGTRSRPRTSRSAGSSTSCRKVSSPTRRPGCRVPREARPRGEGQGRRHPHPTRREPHRDARTARLGRRASSPTPRSAPHVGAVRSGLYEQQTHHLLCPCHQSTFDVHAGPQGHRTASALLPQQDARRATTKALVRLHRSAEAVGPSFWKATSPGTLHGPRPADALARRRDQPWRGGAFGGARAGGVVGWVDDGTCVASGQLRPDQAFPDQWGFMLGEIGSTTDSRTAPSPGPSRPSGWFLAPATRSTTWSAPWRGVGMSEAFRLDSLTLFHIKGLAGSSARSTSGLCSTVHCRTHRAHGPERAHRRLRKPREINWVIGTVLAPPRRRSRAPPANPPTTCSGHRHRPPWAGIRETGPVIGTYWYGILRWADTAKRSSR